MMCMPAALVLSASGIVFGTSTVGNPSVMKRATSGVFLLFPRFKLKHSSLVTLKASDVTKHSITGMSIRTYMLKNFRNKTGQKYWGLNDAYFHARIPAKLVNVPR